MGCCSVGLCGNYWVWVSVGALSSLAQVPVTLPYRVQQHIKKQTAWLRLHNILRSQYVPCHEIRHLIECRPLSHDCDPTCIFILFTTLFKFLFQLLTPCLPATNPYQSFDTNGGKRT
jgi:hypothetical protein